MTNTIPKEWSKGDLFQEFDMAANADALYGIVLQHRAQIDSLTGHALVQYCEQNIKPHLPSPLIDILNDMKSGKTNASLIRGFKFGEDTAAKAEKTPIAVTTMAALNALLGMEPARNDKNEIRVDEIFPENEGGTKQIRSAARLDYSNDAMAAQHVPKFGAVACIQGDPAATIDIHDTNTLIDNLSLISYEDLQKSHFWFEDGSWMKGAVESAGHMHDQPDHPTLRLIKTEDGYSILSSDGIRYSQESSGQGEYAQMALDELKEIIKDKQPLSLKVEYGDIVLRNNRETLYGRSECENFGLGEDVSLLVRQRAFAPGL